MYDQRRTARFESVLRAPAPTPALTTLARCILAKLRTEDLWEGGDGKEAKKKNIRKGSPTKPKARR